MQILLECGNGLKQLNLKHNGSFGNKRIFSDLEDPEYGFPDGLCMDDQGSQNILDQIHLLSDFLKMVFGRPVGVPGRSSDSTDPEHLMSL